MNKKNYLSKTCDLIMETHEEYIRVRSGVERLILPITQEYGLTPIQVSVLNLIRKTENATVSSLFRALDFNQGNMSSLCKKLEADGFIEKSRSTEDERKSYLSLTDKGYMALHGIDEFFNFTDDECWLTEEEFLEAEKAITLLRNAAKKVNDRLEETLLAAKNGEYNA
ncbi:MAG: MarR family transcriptional regulator [Ruminococcaceae bacterium]|nr:MarR family transcriptional regulator [Oscillospiraceae bacterium]